MSERRFEPRYAAYEPAELEWAGTDGSIQTRTGLLRNLSRGGALIQLDCAIGLNSPVTVTVRDQRMTGTVRFCYRRTAVYGISVEFEARFQGALRPVQTARV